MKNIKTVVFDLDGTVYQNLVFHSDYIHFLLEGSGKESWESELIDYVEAIYQGKYIKLNAFYKSEHIVYNTLGEFFEKLAAAETELSFEEGLERKGYIYTGDAWAILTLIGCAMGLLDNGRGDEVFKKTRDKMSADGMVGNMRLKNAIIELGKKYKTVLLSNSYAQTAEDFLHQLGFDGVFRQAVYSANKPWGLIENLSKQCPEVLEEPETVLSIGDHAFNDLMPMQRIGCKVLWINPFENVNEAKCDIMVHTLDQLACCLEDMCR